MGAAETHWLGRTLALTGFALAIFLLLLSVPTSVRAAGCGNEALRVEQSATHLPECRAYEQVSPADKGFANIDEAALLGYKFTVADNGNSLGFCFAGAGGAQVGTYCGHYLAQRSEDRWNSRVAAPLACGQDTDATETTFGGQNRLVFSKDLDYAVITQPEAASCITPSLDPAAPMPGNNLYRESLTTGIPSFNLLTPHLSFSASGRSFNTPNGMYQGISDDANHIIYRSSGNQASEGLAVDGTLRLFEWVGATGTIRLVARGVNNAPLSQPSTLAGRPDPMFAARGDGYGGVSGDGKRILFQSAVDPSDGGFCKPLNCELYMRENGSTTYKVSEQECSPACPEASDPDVFLGATPSGHRALFYTGEKLVNEDPSSASCIKSSGKLLGGCDLYLYRHPADPDANPPSSDPDNLILLTADNEPSDGSTANVQGVLGMADDGNTVYFVADGQLVSGQPTTAGSQLYRWQWNGGTPTLQYLATVPSADDAYMWRYGNPWRTLVQRTGSLGTYLLIDTVVQLLPADQDATRDVYRWEGGWSCLSCQPPGDPSAGPSSIQAMTQPGITQDGATQNADPIRVASDDGSRVFFTSMDRLTSDDVNNAQDVYEWNEGTLGLISGGEGGANSKLVGTTPSGEDVFIVTSDRLVGWDEDNLRDVYNVRVEGGFAEPPPPEDICVEAEGCRGPIPSTPPTSSPVTPGVQGPGDPKPRTCKKGSKLTTSKGRTFCKKIKKKKASKKSRRHSSGKGR